MRKLLFTGGILVFMSTTAGVSANNPDYPTEGNAGYEYGGGLMGGSARVDWAARLYGPAAKKMTTEFSPSMAVRFMRKNHSVLRFHGSVGNYNNAVHPDSSPARSLTEVKKWAGRASFEILGKTISTFDLENLQSGEWHQLGFVGWVPHTWTLLSKQQRFVFLGFPFLVDHTLGLTARAFPRVFLNAKTKNGRINLVRTNGHLVGNADLSYTVSGGPDFDTIRDVVGIPDELPIPDVSAGVSGTMTMLSGNFGPKFYHQTHRRKTGKMVRNLYVATFADLSLGGGAVEVFATVTNFLDFRRTLGSWAWPGDKLWDWEKALVQWTQYQQ